MLFRGYDLLLDSELDLPGAWPLGAPAHASEGEERPALRVVLTREPPVPDDGSKPWRTLEAYGLRADGWLVLKAPGVGHYWLNPEATEVYVVPDPGAETDDVSGLLIATGLPMALWGRGEVVLHAAAAVLPGRRTALAIAGLSGSGKSTLLRTLLAGGGHVVADDTVCLRPAPPGTQSLRPQASGLPSGTQVRTAAGRHFVPVPLERRRTAAPLGVVLALSRDGAAPGLRQLHGPEALAMLLCHLHRPLVPQILRRHPTIVPQVAQWLRGLAVYSWNIPIGSPASQPNVKMLEEIADRGDMLSGSLL